MSILMKSKDDHQNLEIFSCWLKTYIQIYMPTNTMHKVKSAI